MEMQTIDGKYASTKFASFQTFLRFPESSFNGTLRAPGPMLKLRVFFAPLRGEGPARLCGDAAERPSAMFSLSISAIATLLGVVGVALVWMALDIIVVVPIDPVTGVNKRT